MTHAPDPNAADDAFKGGSKEDEPGDWDLATESDGVNPGKDDIRDAWAAVDQPGGRTGRYRVTARIGFERGSATAPLVLVRRGRVCAPAARFTG